MKKLLLIVCISCLFSACNTEPDEKRGDSLNDSSDPSSIMLIAKFPNSEDLNFVVATRHIIGYDDDKSCYKFENNDSSSLYLYKYAFSEDVLSFAHQEMSLEGSTPYIPLTDDYYLIDWKWNDFFPLSHFCYNYHKEEFLWAIKTYKPHIFITDVKWNDLTNIADTFHIFQHSKDVEDVEVIGITHEDIDILFHEDNRRYPYPYGGAWFYVDGMRVNQAYDYLHYVESDPQAAKAFVQSYIQFCDSLQSLYQQRLIEIIHNGQILILRGEKTYTVTGQEVR